MEFTTQSEEMGSGEVVVDANIEGPELLIAFNVRFLSEVLEVIGTPNTILEQRQQHAGDVVAGGR